MKKLFILAGLAMSLFITSCKKDKSTNEPDPNPGDQTKVLTKLTTTKAGVITVHNLQYDANKRLTSIRSTDNKEYVLFTYDGTGNLVKLEQVDEEYKNIYTYTYANGIPVSGTFKSWTKENGNEELFEDDELTYTVANEQVTKIKLKLKMNQNVEIEFQLAYQNGRLVTAESGGVFPYKATFTYGNKKPVFPSVTKYALDQAGLSLQFGARNEILSMAYDFPGNDMDYTISNTYTYDSKGYVLTSTDGEVQVKYEYQ